MEKKKQSVAGIIFQNNYQEVLLVKRRDIPVWVLPGGGKETNESLAQAAVRELQEETGYLVKIKKKVAEFHPKNRLTELTHLYECQIIGGAPTETPETSSIAFFPLTNLPLKMPPPYPEWIHIASKQPKKTLVQKTESVTYTILLQKLLKHPLWVSKYFMRKIKLWILKI